jgi:UDP-glucose 4-epimerase
MAKSTALVTGGAGFIGSHLTDYLIEQMGLKVVVLDDLSGGYRENIHSAAQFVQGSILDHALIERLFVEHHFEYVYHLAAYAAEGLSHFIKRFNYNNNLIGSVNLINAAVNHNVKRFVFTSSIAVYGSNQVPMIETLTPIPEDSYGIAKYAVELELKVSHELFGLEYTIFRPHNVYGERQNLGDKYRNVIGIFMNRLMQDQELIVFGDGEQRRAFTYIKDIVPSLARCIEVAAAKNETFNIGTDDHSSVNQLAEAVMAALGRRSTIRHVEARKEVYVAYSDHSKMKRIFPELAYTPLSEGIQAMATWARTAGVRKTQDFSDIEIPKNLPSAWR